MNYIGNAKTFGDALRECLETLGGIRTKSEITAWINQHYANRWKAATLVGHLYGCSVNLPKGIKHHPGFPRFLYAHGNGRYELYDPQKHGIFENGLPAGEQPEALEIASDVIEIESGTPIADSSFAYE